MTPHVRPSLESDCGFIASHLREADKRECDLWGVDPLHSLRQGLAYSLQPLTVVGPSGSPTAMFGATFGNSSDATVWLLGTDEIVTFPMTFLRQSSMWVDHLCRPLRCSDKITGIGNWVDRRNDRHVSWLLWMGFEMTSPSMKDEVEIGYFRKAF
jgi:hypothetical protein